MLGDLARLLTTGLGSTLRGRKGVSFSPKSDKVWQPFFQDCRSSLTIKTTLETFMHTKKNKELNTPKKIFRKKIMCWNHILKLKRKSEVRYHQQKYQNLKRLYYWQRLVVGYYSPYNRSTWNKTNMEKTEKYNSNAMLQIPLPKIIYVDQ